MSPCLGILADRFHPLAQFAPFRFDPGPNYLPYVARAIPQARGRIINGLILTLTEQNTSDAIKHVLSFVPTVAIERITMVMWDQCWQSFPAVR
jgi:hypothetical protein